MRYTCRIARTGLILATVLIAGIPAFAQRWEFGAGAAGTFYTGKDVTVGSLKANTGFKSGWGASAWLGNDMHSFISGEIRYLYQKNDMKLESGGTQYSFGARSQTITYDFLFHGTPRGSKVRPFLAVGAGFRGYQGTGTEVAVQPLNSFAFLTKTSEWTPVVSVGGGIKFMPSKRVAFRAEVRDYLGPVPNKVIAAAPGAKIDGWFHNIVALFGVSVLF